MTDLVPEGYVVFETYKPVVSGPQAVATQRVFLRWRAVRRARQLNELRNGWPLYRWEAVRNGRWWEVTAFQNVLQKEGERHG